MSPSLFFRRCHGRTAALVLFALGLAACARQPVIPLADPSLQPAPAGQFDHVLMPPEARLPRFATVFIAPVEVRLSDYWLRTHRGDYTEADLARIQENYGRFLDETLREGLTGQTGLTLTDERENADVVFRPVLRGLNLYAPDLRQPALTRYYTRVAGNATFDLVLTDPDGAVLAQFIDHRETRANPGERLEWTNRVTNQRDFTRLMRRWTVNLTDYLLIAGAAPRPGGD